MTITKIDELKKNKNLALTSALDQIEKAYGKGSIMRLGDREVDKNIQIIPTGSIALDIALGIGGVPRGRIVEIYGPESSGKTTLVQHIIAEAQKLGGVAALIDAEHAFDPSYAEKTGVDIKELLVSQPDMGEQALEIAETLIRSNAVDVIAIDSVAALVPKAEIEGDIGDSHIALQARLMSQALRKITGAVSKSRTTVIFTNQIRSKIGVMFGNPETTTGGNALKFYASVRMDIRRVQTIGTPQEPMGIKVRVKVVKNKMAPPFKVAEFDIMFAEGISKEGSLVDVAANFGIVKKSGAWYEFNGVKIGQGREAAKQFLKDDKKLFAEIDKKVRLEIATKGTDIQKVGTQSDDLGITEEVSVEE